MPYAECPNANEQCKFWNKEPRVEGQSNGCFADLHHWYHPARDYRSRLEKRFREHFVEFCCRSLHDELHLLPPPDKPTPAEMLNLIREEG